MSAATLTPAEALEAGPELVGTCVRCGAAHGGTWDRIGLCRACRPAGRMAEVLRRQGIRRALRVAAEHPHGPAGEELER